MTTFKKAKCVPSTIMSTAVTALILISLLLVTSSCQAPGSSAAHIDPNFNPGNGKSPTAAKTSFSRTITIDHTKVPNTDQLNFPILVSIADPTLKTIANGGHVQNTNGYDILFYSDAAGTSPLFWEMESYDGLAGTVKAWVQLPTVSHLTDTVFYMFYGAATISTFQSVTANVWDATYKGVWHLSEPTAANNLDSTANANTGVPTNGPAQTSGKISGSLSFAGVNSYVIDGFTNQPQGNVAVTLSAWVKFNNVAGGLELVSFFGTDSAVNKSGYYLYRNGAGNAVVEFGSGLGGATGVTVLAPGIWYFLAGVYDGVTNKVYVNGVQEGSVLFGAANFSGNTHTIGCYIQVGPVPALFLAGQGDEARVSVNRSADYLRTEFNNENSPVTFITLGAEQ